MSRQRPDGPDASGAAATIEEFVRKVVENAAPLTSEQGDLVRSLLPPPSKGMRGTADAA